MLILLPTCREILHIGTDSFHTPDLLTKKCVTSFEGLGYYIAINRPFTGSIVPSKFYQIKKEVLSIMIEVNRRLYMNEKTGQKNYEKLKSDLSVVLNEIKSIFEKEPHPTA